MTSSLIPQEALTDFLELALRGYTVRRIRQLMLKLDHDLSSIPDAALTAFLIESLPDLRARREPFEKAVPELVGLARKMERVRRLAEAAEAIEDLTAMSPKWSGEYRRYLAQIQTEIEPLSIEFAPGDKWADLLSQLVTLGRDDVDQGDVEAAPGTPEPPGA